jgi:hypothetical protein
MSSPDIVTYLLSNINQYCIVDSGLWLGSEEILTESGITLNAETWYEFHCKATFATPRIFILNNFG